MDTATDFLATYLEPLVEDLTPQQARKILSIKPTDRLVARVEELADKANLGSLTIQERSEYEHYVEVYDVIGLLKAKARSLMTDSAP